MRFREGLQVRLQERYRRLYKSNMDTFDPNVRYFISWCYGNAALATVLHAIERSEPDLDPQEFWAGRERHGTEGNWPATEIGRAKVVLWQLREIASGNVNGYMAAHLVSEERNLNDGIRAYVSDAVEPLIEYLQERLSSESDMLYVLERYRRRVLWFEQQRLWEAYQSDTSHGEAIYDADLRRYLFDQGIDFPYSQPASASGKADVVADIETDDPLACEVKLFDAGTYGASYLAKGLHQATRYAEDYGKDVCQLVIFNLSERQLELPSDEPDMGWPPRLHVSGITVFLVVVQAAPRKAASRSGKSAPMVIARADLVAENDR